MLSLNACQRSCWITLLSYVSTNGIGGTVFHLTEEQLMTQAGVSFAHEEWEYTKGVLKKFESLGMITLNVTQNNTSVTIVNWNKRQETYMSNAERQRLFRQRNKKVTPVTNSNATVTLEEKRREEISPLSGGYPFTEFWSKYPRKTEKKKCEKKWLKLDKTTQEIILRDLPLRIKSEKWTKEGGKFIEYPLTYLNGERWNDELKMAKETSNYKTNLSSSEIRL